MKTSGIVIVSLLIGLVVGGGAGYLVTALSGQGGTGLLSPPIEQLPPQALQKDTAGGCIDWCTANRPPGGEWNRCVIACGILQKEGDFD